MKTILLIGNTGKNKYLNGQTTKVRLYRDILIKENIKFELVDLKDFTRHPFSAFNKIKKLIKSCDRIVLLTAQRGARILIPYINSINKKYHKPFILPMIGVNILHKYIDKLNDSDHYAFMHDFCFKDIRPKKRDVNQLRKITYILPENNMIKEVLVRFFNLDNVFTLQNFRDAHLISNKNNQLDDGLMKILFLSRITRNKGVFQLIDAVENINKEKVRIKLDIYGEKYLNNQDNLLFESKLNKYICYAGAVDNSEVISKISLYDLFVFPTLFKSEGTPGVIAESFIAGVPILSSDFAQSSALMENNKNAIIYSPSTTEELKKNILKLSNRDILNYLSKNASLEGEKYLYSYNRNLFLKYICGIENEN